MDKTPIGKEYKESNELEQTCTEQTYDENVSCVERNFSSNTC